MNIKAAWILELNRKFLIASLSAVIILILFFVCWTAVRTGKDARAELLQQAQLAAHTIDAGNIQALTGSGLDLQNPKYRQIKKLLATVRNGTPQCRFAYLLGRKTDGTLFFFADSEPETSKDYSPPGQAFEESTPEVRNIFNTGQGLTEGPVADRWGVWVSALAPITARQDGSVVAVLGIDIDASTWNWQVTYRAAATLGLLLLLMTGLIIILIKSHHAGVSARPVIRRLMLPLGFIVVFLIAGSIVLMWHQHQQNLKTALRDDLVDVIEDMHTAIEQQASGLTAAALTVAGNPAVQKALRESKADTLSAAWMPVFEQMRQKINLTHFNFIDRNRVCLLRLSRLELHGDRIDRFTAIEAERTGRAAFGIESGGLEILVLRVVQPVFEAGRLVGYVELGRSINEVMRKLHIRSDVQLALFVRKNCIARGDWEEWMRSSGRKTGWDSLPDNVLFYSGNERMAAALSSSAEIAHGTTTGDIAFDGRSWRIASMPLSDASGREIGHLLSMRDITPDKQEFSQLLGFGVTGGALLLAFLLGFIYLLLFRTDRKIISQQLILQGNEERLSQLAEQSGTVAWEVDAGGMYTYISDVVKKVLGYSPEDIVGHKRFYDMHPEDGRKEFKTSALAVFEKKEPFINLVNRMLAADGHIVWVTTSGIPILAGDGTLLGYRGADVDITERKLTEEALRETRDYLDKLFNYSNTPVIIWDSKFRITQFNNAFEKLSGRNVADVLGKQVDILFPAETREYSLECIKRTTGGERWDVVEIQIQHTDGRVFTLLWNSATIYSTDQTTIIGTIAQGYDITGRKQAESSLRESNELNRSMLQTIPFGMDIVDEEGNILFINDKLERIVGNDAIGRKCWSVYRDDKSQCHDCPLQTGINIGGTEIYETDGVLGGRIFQIIHTGMLFHGRKAMLEIFQDITERKNAEDALKKSEEQNRTILQTAMDGFWKADMQGRLLEVNDTYAMISGYSVEELLTMRVSDLEINENQEEIAEHMQKVVNRTARRFETRHRRKDGTFVDVEVSVNFQPEFNLFVAFIRDITERLKSRQELVSAKEHAEESDRLKTAFLNNISHEIRTPFNCILGFLAILDDNTLPANERSEYVSMINKAAERLMNAINDIVEMSKIQTGQVKVVLSETDINKLAGELAERFEPQARIKNLTFSLNNCLGPADCNITTDDDKLNSVLGILINNAIKFTNAGSIELSVQRNGNWLEFSVKDTGVGIPADRQHRIFEHFMQADVSNTRKFEGSGLGLAIAKAYVEMLGGSIGFDSQEGRGSTFHFKIPVVNDNSKLRHEHKYPAENKNFPLSSKILVTEDDDVNFEYINAVLIRAGYDVIHARTGAEAVEICRNNTDIGTILMDIKMPVMDGYIATREIRKFNPSVPIIAITAYAETGDRKKCLEAGMNDFASKPVTPRDMMEVLDKWLSKQNTQ